MRPPRLTPAMRRVLEWLDRAEREREAGAGDEDPELVCEGIRCWVGSDPVGYRTTNSLLRYMLIKDVSDGGALQRYAINDAGRAALARPAILGEIAAALARGGSYEVSGTRLVALPG